VLTSHPARIGRILCSSVPVFFCSLVLFIAGCGTSAGTHPVPPATVTITAQPTSINAGDSATLTVTAANAQTVTISGSDGSSYNLDATGGTQKVTPAKTTTYTATATGTSGKATATATVTVGAATGGPNPTVSISASPGSITPGGTSTLTVAATNASAVSIAGSDGTSYNLAATGGTQDVKPAATATYTATAVGTNGAKVTATATVTVTAGPTVTITANPASVSAGSSSTLTVAATNATGVIVTGSDGSSYTLAPTGGTQSVKPTATTTYTATATAANGGTPATATATVTVTAAGPPTVTIVASPTSISQGNSSTLTVTATNASSVSISGSDSTSYNLAPNGGDQKVTPSTTTTYTATATGPGGTVSATATVTVVPPGNINSIDHVIFMLQENHSFDNYFGMLNPYRAANGFSKGADGNTYLVDGIADTQNNLTSYSNVNDQGQSFSLFKFASTCVDDMSSAWLESYGDVNRYDFATTRKILMDGFVHTAQGFATSCVSSGACSGTFTDTDGKRSMGYYDQGFLNYYYYMASQFALSDRWFSPIASKSVDNRIATFTGGTTQGLVKDPGNDDHLPQLNIANIFQELDQANVSWKIYYTVNQAMCADPEDCPNTGSKLPGTDFLTLSYSTKYVYNNPSGATCTAPTVGSHVVGDTSDSFCIDPMHIAPLQDPKYGYFADLTNSTLPSFAFIEAGYGNNDEHPGSGQSILAGQYQVSTIINALMKSASWKDSVFFLSYDEGGGPFDHVPPVPTHSNDNTNPNVVGVPVTSYPDISGIAVNPDSYNPCVPSGGTATTHCDLSTDSPGAQPTDAAAVNGFSAQLGFRVPNMVISPFTKAHYVSHVPMDHTAIIKFVENRFIGSSAHLTNRDAAQPNLMDFFDFTSVPWATPPSPPAPVTATSLGFNPCTPDNMGP
jgi:phospholipase C